MLVQKPTVTCFKGYLSDLAGDLELVFSCHRLVVCLIPSCHGFVHVTIFVVDISHVAEGQPDRVLQLLLVQLADLGLLGAQLGLVLFIGLLLPGSV